MKTTLLSELIWEKTKSSWSLLNVKKRRSRKRYFTPTYSFFWFISRNWKSLQIAHQNDQDQNRRWNQKLAVRVVNPMSAVHRGTGQNHHDQAPKKILKRTRFHLHHQKALKPKTNQCVSIIIESSRRVFKLMLAKWRSQPIRRWAQSINLKTSLGHGSVHTIFLAKNPYSKLENERKRKELELKKKIDSPKISKTTFRKDSEPSLPTDFISDAFNSVPVQGLPPGIPIVNYTNKVMNNITAVFKVRFGHKWGQPLPMAHWRRRVNLLICFRMSIKKFSNPWTGMVMWKIWGLKSID